MMTLYAMRRHLCDPDGSTLDSRIGECTSLDDRLVVLRECRFPFSRSVEGALAFLGLIAEGLR